MKIALIDNGSLEPAAHAGLRAAAEAIGARAEVRVEAVSWRHSDRIPSYALGGGPALTLVPWVRDQVAAGEREFLFIPFFISPQGAIGSSLRRDLLALQAEAGGLEFSFADGLGAEAPIAAIVADRVREAAGAAGLDRPPAIVVDHGGPQRASAEVRDEVADAARALLGGEVSRLVPASMESPDGPEFDFNRPLLSEALLSPGFNGGDVLVAPLFLSPGRHAGPGGDLHRIAREAEARSPGLRCHFTGLVGTHPLATEHLASSLVRALSIGALP
jgi:sirohydrochlorin ferrochelatase